MSARRSETHASTRSPVVRAAVDNVCCAASVRLDDASRTSKTASRIVIGKNTARVPANSLKPNCPRNGALRALIRSALQDNLPPDCLLLAGLVLGMQGQIQLDLARGRHRG